MVLNISNRLYHQSKIQILFVRNNHFSRFDDNGEQQVLPITGVAGLVFNTQNPMTTNNIGKHQNFSPLVDLNSLLTVYTHPIISYVDANFFTEGYGVIQFILKKQV